MSGYDVQRWTGSKWYSIGGMSTSIADARLQAETQPNTRIVKYRVEVNETITRQVVA